MTRLLRPVAVACFLAVGVGWVPPCCLSSACLHMIRYIYASDHSYANTRFWWRCFCFPHSIINCDVGWMHHFLLFVVVPHHSLSLELSYLCIAMLLSTCERYSVFVLLLLLALARKILSQLLLLVSLASTWVSFHFTQQSALRRTAFAM